MDKTNMSGAVHDLEVMGLIPGWVKLWVHSTSCLVRFEPKNTTNTQAKRMGCLL